MQLKGKCALITGSSEGLGLKIAEEFVKEGASVMICARRAEPLAVAYEALQMMKQPWQAVHARITDMAEFQQIDNLFEETITKLGTIDILVNNAGVYGPMGPLEEVDWDQWVESIKINLFGLTYACRKVIPILKAKKEGKIINISGGGATNPLPNISGYAVAKAGVVRLTETLAGELGEYGVDVNAVAPGFLATRLTDQLLDSGPNIVGHRLYERIRSMRDSGGTPLEVGAGLCVYLASSDSNGVTGKLIAAQWDPWPFSEDVKGELRESDIYTLRRIVGRDRGKTWESN